MYCGPNVISANNRSELPTRCQKMIEMSVKCPQFYKDSAAADLMQNICPGPQHKVLIYTNTAEQANRYFSSVYLNKTSLILHREQDRRERIRIAKNFQQSTEKKCLILGSIYGTNLPKTTVRLIILTSPPNSVEIYQSLLGFVEGTKYVTICYSTKQITKLCSFQSALKRKFQMLEPPDVQSDSDELEEKKSQKSSKQRHPPVEYKVVVKNIPNQFYWRDLKNFLAENNVHVLDVRLVDSKLSSSTPVKTGFVICRDKQSYDKAIALNGSNFYGAQLRFSEYTPKK